VSKVPRDEPRGHYARGYLPLLDLGEWPQAVTYHLADSLPADAIQRMQAELLALPDGERAERLSRSIQRYLDAGHGACVLRNTDIAAIVEENLLHFDGDRYHLHAWVVMPNHVHVVFTPIAPAALAEILHTWKSYTAKAINRLLGTYGDVWFPDYRDRAIRDQRHFDSAILYAEFNPVAAGLCARPEDWMFSSARRRS
jgi:putative DNA methylase